MSVSRVDSHTEEPEQNVLHENGTIASGIPMKTDNKTTLYAVIALGCVLGIFILIGAGILYRCCSIHNNVSQFNMCVCVFVCMWFKGNKITCVLQYLLG